MILQRAATTKSSLLNPMLAAAKTSTFSKSVFIIKVIFYLTNSKVCCIMLSMGTALNIAPLVFTEKD